MDNKKLIELYLGNSKDNPIDKITKALKDVCYYNETEVGLYHPTNSSLIKIRDNGVIDIFVSTNQGLRIDPSTHSINFFSNNEKHTSGNVNYWIEENMDLDIKQKFLIKASDIIIDSLRSTINSKSLDVNISKENINLGGLTVKSIEDSLTDIKNDIIDIQAKDNTIENRLNNLESMLNQILSNLNGG